MSLLGQLGYLIPTLSRPYPGQKLVVPCPYLVLILTLLQPYPNLIPSLSRPYPNLISSLSRPYLLKKNTKPQTLTHAFARAYVRAYAYTIFHGSPNTKNSAFACLVFELGRFSGFFRFCFLSVLARGVLTKQPIF